MTTLEQKAIELALEGFKLIDLYKLQPDSVQSFVNHYTWHIKETLKKVEPEQEPVAWMRKDETCTDCFVWERTDEHTIPLYTTPPQRTWVDLTDEEIRKLCVTTYSGYEFCRLVETKLREKNQ